MKNTEKDKSPIVNLYTVYDLKAGTYYPPFTSQNDDTASRSFGQMVKNPDTAFAQNAEDYRLFRIGDFDPSDCQIDLLVPLQHVCDALDFVPVPAKNLIVD